MNLNVPKLLGMSVLSLSLLTSSFALANNSANTITHQIDAVKKTTETTPVVPVKIAPKDNIPKKLPNIINANKQNAITFQAFTKMYENMQHMNYTMYFINEKDNSVNGYMLTNYFKQNHRYSLLRNLEGDLFQVILKDGVVSYPKFSISNNFISDMLPTIINANIKDLSTNYSFTKNYETRIANRQADIYDVSNKYTNLFAYQVSLDHETNLPLKVVLVERDLINNTFLILDTWTVEYLDIKPTEDTYNFIKNYKTNNSLIFAATINQQIVDAMSKIIHLPYLPSGFKLQSTQEVTLYGDTLINNGKTGKPQEYYAATYNDGLFSFNIYVSKNEITTKDHYYYRHGDTSLYAENYAHRNIIVIGQIPMLLAKGIANSIQVYKTPTEFYEDKHPENLGQRLSINDQQ